MIAKLMTMKPVGCIWKMLGCLAMTVVLASCRSSTTHTSASQKGSSSKMERVVVDGRGFALAKSENDFYPWGLNYGNHGRLIEDFWDTEWATVESDFQKMKKMNANVVRVHLQFGKFMDAPDKPNEHALKQFSRLVHLAEKTGLYLDITGLGCYRPADVPAWYDALDEQPRWAAQAAFWSAIAKAGDSSPALFCFDLMNEPFVAGSARKPGEWRSGHLLGSGRNAYDFIQFINLDAAGRVREEIAQQWIAYMTAAIRAKDGRTLITVGQLPWSREWHHLSGFDPSKIKDEVDFISVHIYPDSKTPDEAMDGLGQFAVGKPVVIEETFPLSCDVPELEQFLVESRAFANGWMGHYDGESLKELDALNRAGKITPVQSAYRAWLELFVRLAPDFT